MGIRVFWKSLMVKWLEQASQWNVLSWNVLSWSGGHEFEPRSGQTWGAWYFCPTLYLNQNIYFSCTLGITQMVKCSASLEHLQTYKNVQVWFIYICLQRCFWIASHIGMMAIFMSLEVKGESCWPWTMLTLLKTSNYIHLFPKHNQPPRTVTHLSLRIDSLPGPDQDSPLNGIQSWHCYSLWFTTSFFF